MSPNQIFFVVRNSNCTFYIFIIEAKLTNWTVKLDFCMKNWELNSIP